MTNNKQRNKPRPWWPCYLFWTIISYCHNSGGFQLKLCWNFATQGEWMWVIGELEWGMNTLYEIEITIRKTAPANKTRAEEKRNLRWSPLLLLTRYMEDAVGSLLLCESGDQGRKVTFWVKLVIFTEDMISHLWKWSKRSSEMSQNSKQSRLFGCNQRKTSPECECHLVEDVNI